MNAIELLIEQRAVTPTGKKFYIHPIKNLVG